MLFALVPINQLSSDFTRIDGTVFTGAPGDCSACRAMLACSVGPSTRTRPCEARQPSRAHTLQPANDVPGLALHFGRARACGHRRLAQADRLWSGSPLPPCLRSFPACAGAAGFSVVDSYNSKNSQSFDVDTRYGGTPLLLTQPQWQRLISRAISCAGLALGPLCTARSMPLVLTF